MDIGCGSKPYRHLFDHVDNYIGTEMLGEGGKSDVLADGMDLPFSESAFDTLILTTPQVWGLHHEPHDYYRDTKYGLSHLSQQHGLKVLHVAPTCGIWATMAQRLADTVAYDYTARWPRVLRPLIGLCLAPILLAGLLLDRLVGKRGDTLDNILIARKTTSRGAASTCRKSPTPLGTKK